MDTTFDDGRAGKEPAPTPPRPEPGGHLDTADRGGPTSVADPLRPAAGPAVPVDTAASPADRLPTILSGVLVLLVVAGAATLWWLLRDTDGPPGAVASSATSATAPVPTPTVSAGPLTTTGPQSGWGSGSRKTTPATAHHLPNVLPRLPDVVGLDAATASARLADAGYRDVVTSTRRSSTATRYAVIATAPAPRTRTDTDTTVTIYLPDRPGHVAVPDVRHLAESDALALLESHGVRARTVRTPAPDGIPGVVSRQEPPPLTLLPHDDEVTLLVAEESPTPSDSTPALSDG